jgi:transposase
MTKNHILAMDISQNRAVVQLEQADGTRCWKGSLETTQAGWSQLHELMARVGARPEQTLVVMEATGVHHLPWAERLHADGLDVHVLNPLLASRLHSTANALRGHKTDAVDAASLAEAARLHHEKLTRFRYESRPHTQGLRQLDHARRQLRTLLTNLRKCLKSHVELVFPALLAAGIEPWSVRGRQLLAHVGTAGGWTARDRSARLTLAGAKSDELDQACAQTLADEAVAQACLPAVRVLLDAEDALDQRLQACDRQIASLLPAERVRLISTLPGFGERTAAVMTTYLPADLERWGQKKQTTARLQALFGCDPRLKTSGKWTGKIKISKCGISSARTALFQAAFCSLATDPENAACYQRLRSSGKAHKEAIVALMRKQLRRLVSVLRSGQPFQPRPPSPAPHPNIA